jgi:molybdopterin/thiamine biosynthesis adenylyltransferase
MVWSKLKTMRNAQTLTTDEKAVYEWQMWVAGFGESGQVRLKNASVMISRVGGVGGAVAFQLAAAGIGKLILAHAGNVKPSDLNRQLLMTHDWIGKPRIQSIVRRLQELNPRLEVVPVAENVNTSNVAVMVQQADLIVDCAPLFPERLAMNLESVRQGKPMVECAMYELEAQITTFLPGKTPCLHCLCPVAPAIWKRQFPVFGAVSGTIGSLAAMEAIKVISGLGEPLFGRMLSFDLRAMTTRTLKIQRRVNCDVCGPLNA